MPLSPVPHVRGLLLAAGAGRRFGGPKALARQTEHGPTLVEAAVGVLQAGGCDGVTVVTGAAADEVVSVLTTVRSATGPAGSSPTPGPPGRRADLEEPDVDLVVCHDWADGMGASLRAGLAALAVETSAAKHVEAALVTLVDLPDVGPEVVARLLSHLHAALDPDGPEGSRSQEGAWRAVLARAAYGGVPGHPALIGRDHWEGVMACASGDRGARDYYRTHAHHLIECGDLASGRDADRPEELEELGSPRDGYGSGDPARSD